MGARKEGNSTGHKLDRGDPRGCVATIGEDYYIAHEVRQTNGEQGDMENHGKDKLRESHGSPYFSILPAESEAQLAEAPGLLCIHDGAQLKTIHSFCF